MRREAMPVDSGGFDDPLLTLEQALVFFSERYNLACRLRGPAQWKEQMNRRKASPVPRYMGSMGLALQSVLDLHNLSYVPFLVSPHQAGFEVVDPASAAKTRFVILYAARDILASSKDIQVSQLIADIRQFVGKSKSSSGEKEAVVEFLPSSQAVQVEASWSVQKEVNRYLAELRKIRRPAGRSGGPE
jgi:hypothetical protein